MDRSLDEIIAEDPVSFELDSGFNDMRCNSSHLFPPLSTRHPVLRVAGAAKAAVAVTAMALERSALLFLNRIILRRDTIVASPLEARRLANDEETAAKTEKSTVCTLPQLIWS
ncbi:hypothetical protein N7450_005842 [Penicillium hetheringtonii]|uniref:Uncharacterized protein n=1 Tax=Penicillium hetheringtonii TaxID=911720 RepID=A0AAD6GRD4_9EURO|nr:hypothetical protein N7450_005842 [Penicillium hetheringtonii]